MKNNENNVTRKEDLYFEEMLSEVPTTAGKGLIMALTSVNESLDNVTLMINGNYTSITKETVFEGLNDGQPFESIYISFKKEDSEKILGYKLECTEEELDVDKVEVKGLKFPSFCYSLWVDGDEIIVVGWVSLSEDCQYIDFNWEEDKSKILSYIDSLEVKDID